MSKLINTRNRKIAFKLALLMGAVLMLVGPSDPGYSDDTFLFRVQSGKPYLQIMFDTSSSMNLSAQMGGVAVASNGDSPLSTFHQAKSAMFEVFDAAHRSAGDFVHYGFYSYNQDGLRVRGKHWLYMVEASNVMLGATPYAEPGEVLVFGARIPDTATPDATALFMDPATPGVLGSCTQPVDLATEEAASHRFPKLHPLDNVGADGMVDDMDPTVLWLADGSSVYQVAVSTHLDPVSGQPSLLNRSTLLAEFTVTPYFDCSPSGESVTEVVSLNLIRPFLMHDLLGADNASDIVLGPSGPSAPGFPPSPPGGGGGGGGTQDPELQDGLWNYQDYTARAVCGDDAHPFTGVGFEGNYDSGTFTGAPADFPNVDPYQVGSLAPPAAEWSLKFPTIMDPDPRPEWRTLDRGDALPFHWTRTNREDFFRRLAPNWTPGADIADLDFGIATYFRDVPNSDGFLELIDPNVRPLMAFGDSPIGESLVDWRCFYLGNDQAGGKCRDDEQPFGRGWDWLAPQFDLEWGCRKPYIIVIGDGENNCRGENPAADTANLRRNRVQAWVINFGGPDSRDLRSLAQNTGGEYIEVSNRDELLTVLENILGIIIEETKAFASAVVPTVQAQEADKIYISNFKPLNQAQVWPGALQAFLKPVPVASGKPDTSTVCANDPDIDPASECYLWNAGEEMVDQVTPDISLQFGTGPQQRRVYYSALSTSGQWPNGRRYIAPTVDGVTPETVRYDLWRGLNMPGHDWNTTATDSLTGAEEDALELAANDVVTKNMELKVDDNDTPADLTDDVDYIMGDIFHADPLILGSPVNTKFFGQNVEDDGTLCEDGNPGYRCFFRKHQKRRRVVLLGSNDTQVHAIDAGIYRTSGAFADEFDRGTGREIFAFSPRSVLPLVENMFGPLSDSRQWAVDGDIVGFDAFIDPLHNGTPTAGDREWRTVVIGGLRRGGVGYYALDLTQPDTYDGDGAPQPTNGYVPSCIEPLGGADCGPTDYASQLWEFDDSELLFDVLGNPLRTAAFDHDQDGLRDLVEGWSAPNLGMIQICTSSCGAVDQVLEARHVAVFGGGFDKSNATGNWIYMVDVETGKSIYKEQLLDPVDLSSGGAVAAEPAAVDSDGDGFLDRIYIATLKGFVYRADLVGPAGEIPQLEDDVDYYDEAGVPEPVDLERITDPLHRPHLIFKAQPDVATPGPTSRAIYYRPTVIFSAALGQYVVAIGVGDRDNLWSSDSERGIFYVFKDDIPDSNPLGVYYTEDDLVPIDSEIDPDRADNLLTDPLLSTKGWNLLLRPEERLITSPFAISGVLVFSVFKPDVEVDEDDLTCSRTGTSRVFGVTATNANGLLVSGGARTRWFDIADFVTEPYVEQSATKNPDRPGGGDTADDLDEDHLAIMEELKTLFPSNCKFANYRLDIKTLSSDTGIHLIAPIPICIVEKNWKEF